MTVTWNSPWVGAGATDASDVDATAAGSAPLNAVGAWLTVDVTAAVQAWASGTENDGLILIYTSSSSTEYSLSSRTVVGQEPTLTITYY
jgi:hypothetical protein